MRTFFIFIGDLRLIIRAASAPVVKPKNQWVFFNGIVTGRNEKAIRHVQAFFVGIHFFAKWRLFLYHARRGDPLLTGGVRAAGNEHEKNNR
jgi:hypothetical protein